MRIRVTTRADLFQKRKQEHIECGYQIEDERPNSRERFLFVCRRPGTARLRQTRRSRRCCQPKPHSP